MKAGTKEEISSPYHGVRLRAATLMLSSKLILADFHVKQIQSPRLNSTLSFGLFSLRNPLAGTESCQGGPVVTAPSHLLCFELYNHIPGPCCQTHGSS